jgi:hypothetical protein
MTDIGENISISTFAHILDTCFENIARDAYPPAHSLSVADAIESYDTESSLQIDAGDINFDRMEGTMDTYFNSISNQGEIVFERSLASTLKAFECLSLANETKLAKFIDICEKDLSRLSSKLAYKLRLEHSEIKKNSEVCAFVEQTMKLYYEKLEKIYQKVLKRSRRNYEVETD